MRTKIILFFTGILQVTPVSLNTYQIAHGKKIGIFLVGFWISLVWAFNVKMVAFGDLLDKIAYATGAACGSLFGYYLAVTLYKKKDGH